MLKGALMKRIYKTTYKGICGKCLENEQLKAIFLPDHGAKLCSLIRKDTGKEYVYQGKSETYRLAHYGQNYLEGECAGVDEMFPTIDAEFYRCRPWEGTYFPDHGELWARRWESISDDMMLCMSIHSVKLPCILKKKVCLLDNKVHIEYELTNLSEFPIDYIWAAHMMFHAEEGAYFEFDKDLSKAYVTMSDSGTIGSYGDIFTYPFAKCKDGGIYDIRMHRGEVANDYQKFYFAQKLTSEQGWGKIWYPDGSCLTVDFPAKELPYLGVVQAEGGTLNLRCMFLEPCTGAFDSTSAARMHNMLSVLRQKETKKWYLNIEIANGGGKNE